MNPFRFGFAALGAATLLAACDGESRRLVILHTNDEHSHLLGSGSERDEFPVPSAAGSGAVKGGLARRATVINSERGAAQGSGAAVLTVSGGDVMMGTLVQATTTTFSPDYKSLDLLGYDVAVLGNHEFDFGPKALAAAIQAANASGNLPHLVSSNIRFSGTPGDADLAALFDESGRDMTKPVHRSLVLTASNGLRVGFVGILGADAANVAPTKAPVRFSQVPGLPESAIPSVMAQLFSDVQVVVDRLRRDEDVDLVIALSHSGTDRTVPRLGEDFQIAENVAGIDVIVSGHTHNATPAFSVMNKRTGRPVLVQEAGRFGEVVGRIEIEVDDDGTVRADPSRSRLLEVDDRILPDQQATNFVNTVMTELDKSPVLLGTVRRTLKDNTIADNGSSVGDVVFREVGKSAFDVLDDAAQKETQLLVLAADAELAALEEEGFATDLTLIASGVIRSHLERADNGAITFADVFRVLPLGGSPADGTMGYPLTRFLLFFAEVKAAFEFSAGVAQASEKNAQFFLVPSGMTFEFDMGRAPFNTAADPLDPNNGRVTKISLAPNHSGANIDVAPVVLFDLSKGAQAWQVNPLQVFRVGGDLYHATLAHLAGLRLKTFPSGAVMTDPAEGIVRRADGSEIKAWEALGRYIQAQTAANGGTLPDRYQKKADWAPRRAKCFTTNAAVPCK